MEEGILTRLKRLESQREENKENPKLESTQEKKIGWTVGSGVGILASVVTFIICLFYMSIGYNLLTTVAVFIVFSVFVSKMNWQPWIPWKAKVGKRIKAQKGFVIIRRIHDNKTFDWEKHRIIDETIVIDNIPRVINANDIIYRKGKPYADIYDSSTIAVNTWRNLADLKNEFGTKGWKLVLNRLKNEAITEKKKFGGMGTIIIVLLVIGGLAYFAFKAGWI